MHPKQDNFRLCEKKTPMSLTSPPSVDDSRNGYDFTSAEATVLYCRAFGYLEKKIVNENEMFVVFFRNELPKIVGTSKIIINRRD
jgi:hypothetical protein